MVPPKRYLYQKGILTKEIPINYYYFVDFCEIHIRITKYDVKKQDFSTCG